MTIQARIKAARLGKGYTQQMLADLLNVSQAMIGQYETSKHPPKISTVKKIADALQVDANYLLIGDESKNFNIIGSYEDIESGAVAREVKKLGAIARQGKLLMHFSRLNEDGKDEAIRDVERLTEIPRFQNQEPISRNKPMREITLPIDDE